MARLRFLVWILGGLLALLPAAAWAQAAPEGTAAAPEAGEQVPEGAPGEGQVEAPADEGPFLPGEPVDLSYIKAYRETIGWTRMDDGEAALKVSGQQFSAGLCTWTFDEGYLFPIFNGRTPEEWAEEEGDDHEAEAEDDDEGAGDDAEQDASPFRKVELTPEERAPRIPVGFVFVGKGTMEVRFGSPHDALSFANRMVSKWDADVEAMRPIAKEGAPFRTTIEKGWVMSAGPELREFLKLLQPVAPRRDVRTTAVGEDVELIVESSKAFKKAWKTARKVFEKRLDSFSIVGDPKMAIATDRLRIEQLGMAPSDARTYADFFTGQRYGLVIQEKHYPFGTAEDQWLSTVVDPSGAYDSRFRSEVFAFGENDYGRKVVSSITGEVFPPSDPADPLSPPFPPRSVRGTMADLTFDTRFTKNRFFLETEAEILMTVRAEGADIPFFSMYIPRQEADREGWEFRGVTLEDGTPVTLLDPSKESFKDFSGEVTVIFPRPLREGQEATLKVAWKGTWPYANIVEFGTQKGTTGLSTGLLMPMPNLMPSRIGNPFPFRMRVAVPADSELTAALSGTTDREWTEDGKRWVEASYTEKDAMYFGLAVGKWINYDEPAQKGLPAIRVHLFPEEEDTIRQFPPEMRRIISFYQDFLPDWPFREQELFQAPDMYFGFIWIAPHGMVNLTKTRVDPNLGVGEQAFRKDTPHLESGVLAHELAHQYWGHVVRGGSIYEGWIHETFAESYSCLYVGAAYGKEDFEKRMDAYRERWEEKIDEDEFASLPRAYYSPFQPAIVYNYGPYVMHKMLRRRIGDQAFFASLDRFASEHYQEFVSTEQLQRTFEEVSGKDLDDFFEYWVWGGYIPSLELTWHLEGDQVVGTITSDIPFGTFDVPVRVKGSGDASQDVWVDVVDGRATFTAPALAGEDTEVELDPEGYILANERKVRKE